MKLIQLQEPLMTVVDEEDFESLSQFKWKAFKGVHRVGNKYRATIMKDGHKMHCGYFDSEVEAALAYNTAAMTYFGHYAKLNTF